MLATLYLRLIAAVRIRRLAGLDGGDTACGIWLSIAVNDALYVEEKHVSGLYEAIGWGSSEELAYDLSSVGLWLRGRAGRTTLDTIFGKRLGLNFDRERDSSKYASHIVTKLSTHIKRPITWINLGAPATRTTSPESQYDPVSPARVRVGHFRRLTMKITERDVRTNVWAQNYITTKAFKRATVDCTKKRALQSSGKGSSPTIPTTPASAAIKKTESVRVSSQEKLFFLEN